ncbi:hypothetical protein HDU86_002944 [Geranomyces michiganensis]|nr:hypothetical protein HDU86_002944 [Geranomyces michiganensis]
MDNDAFREALSDLHRMTRAAGSMKNQPEDAGSDQDSNEVCSSVVKTEERGGAYTALR